MKKIGHKKQRSDYYYKVCNTGFKWQKKEAEFREKLMKQLDDYVDKESVSETPSEVESVFESVFESESEVELDPDESDKINIIISVLHLVFGFILIKSMSILLPEKLF